MKRFIVNIIQKLNRWGVRRKFLNKEISAIMKKSKIPNKKLPHEDIWSKKWSKLLSNTDRRYYRIYSKFIGADINIMPDDVCHFIVESTLNPIKYRNFYSDKNMFDRVLSLRFNDIVTPKSFVRNIEGKFYDLNYNLIGLEPLNLAGLLEADRIVVKPSVDSSSGKGVLFFEKIGESYVGGENGKQELSVDFLDRYYGKNYVIQEAVKQSAFISQFCPTSVNTLRVQVYRSVITGEVHIPNVIMRLGKKGSLVDNAHAGGCFIGIDVNTGKFQDKVFNQFGEHFDKFNDVDFKKCSYIIPNFDAIKKFAKKVGECIPHHHIISLDIMLNEDNNPMLIEYNIGAFSLWFFQITGNTVFGEFTDEVIEYCMKKRTRQ